MEKARLEGETQIRSLPLQTSSLSLGALSPDGKMFGCWNSRPDPFGLVATMGRTRIKDL